VRVHPSQIPYLESRPIPLEDRRNSARRRICLSSPRNYNNILSIPSEDLKSMPTKNSKQSTSSVLREKRCFRQFFSHTSSLTTFDTVPFVPLFTAFFLSQQYLGKCNINMGSDQEEQQEQLGQPQGVVAVPRQKANQVDQAQTPASSNSSTSTLSQSQSQPPLPQPNPQSSSMHDASYYDNRGEEGASEQPTGDAPYHSLSYAYSTYLQHDREEQNHWEDVCRSYRQYAMFAMAQWANHQYRLHAVPESQRRFLPAGLRRDSPEFQRRAKLYKEAAIRNQFCLDCILRHANVPHSQETNGIDSVKQPQQQSPKLRNGGDSNKKRKKSSDHSQNDSSSSVSNCSTDAQMSKVSSVLKSLVRDWSSEGKAERDAVYKPILQQLQKFVPIRRSKNGDGGGCRLPPRICVPGAGVGRLALEMSALGYAVQGNEFSLYMLLASDFILNGGIATPQTPIKISPWLLETRNVHSWKDPLRAIEVPDVDPYSMVMNDNCDGINSNGKSGCDGCDRHIAQQGDDVGREGGGGEEEDAKSSLTLTTKNTTGSSTPDFSMAAGEFVSIYSTERERGRWDAVIACFFLDTSPSVVEYLQTIYKMLKPGGTLINFGPLQWHWSGPAMRPDDRTVEDYRGRYSYLDKKYLSSIDLCWEDIREILVNIGFEIADVSMAQQAHYTADRLSMVNMEYRCVNFVARKKAAEPIGAGVVIGTLVEPTSSGELQR